MAGAARRARHHGACRLHDGAARRRERRRGHARVPRPDLFPDGAHRWSGPRRWSDAGSTNEAAAGAENAAPPGRSRQHVQGPGPRQGRRPPRSEGLLARRPRHMNAQAILGLLLLAGTESATLAGIPPFPTWNTPIGWTGFILFADGIVFRARRQSWLRSAPREFAFLALASIPLWLVFEFFNLYIANWHYVGLPENWWLRMLGYGWAFATISPA